MLNDKSHFVSLFEHATEGFVVTGPDGAIVMVNPSACRMFGYTAEELIGKPVEVLVPAEYQAGHTDRRAEFYANPQNRVMGHGRDLYGRHKSGNTFPVEVSLSTYMLDNSRFAIAFIVDITYRKTIEKNMLVQQQQLEKVSDEIRTLNAELEAKVEERTVILKEALQRLEHSQQELSAALDKERQLNEIKGRFVSMASHEFRTPLSTVLSSASLLSRYSGADEQAKRDRHIEKIKGSVKHLNDLLEDFLSLGRLDEGKTAATAEDFNLQALMVETVEELKVLAKPRQEIIMTHSGHERVRTDRKLLKNIVINLLSNAIKFSEPGQVIHADSTASAEAVEITISDKGIGIPSEDLEHLFTSFYRGSNAQNIQGTGLGLHIVKRYLDILQGRINIHSAPGQGTSVKISILLNSER